MPIGSGMAALGSLLYDLGHNIIGSDQEENFGFEHGLIKRNIEILPFDKNNIKGDRIYIIGNAYNHNNPEVLEIKDKNYVHYYYHEFIKKLKGIQIAVAGTHGKTTTTKMIVDLLKGEKIAYLIGDGTGGAVPDYKYFIYEACEYKDHFLCYHPDILIINTVELDHPDYFNNLSDVYRSFNQLASQAKRVIVCTDTPLTIKHHFLTYSLNGKKSSLRTDYSVQIDKADINGYDVEINNGSSCNFHLPFFGEHMVKNFVNSYLALKLLGYSNDFINSRIKNICLPIRRMEETKVNNQIIIQDYAHHPTEIRAVYEGVVQKYPNVKTTVIFQPHTYSRTLALRSGFLEALAFFDNIYIAETFSSAREKKDPLLEFQVQEIFKEYKKYTSFRDILLYQEPHIYLFLGAGDLHKDAFRLIGQLYENG